MGWVTGDEQELKKKFRGSGDGISSPRKSAGARVRRTARRAKVRGGADR